MFYNVISFSRWFSDAASPSRLEVITENSNMELSGKEIVCN